MRTGGRMAICALAFALTMPIVAVAEGNRTSYQKNITVSYGIQVTKNGESVEWIDSNGKVVSPFVYEETAYVPLKTLAPLLGAYSSYTYENNSVNITTYDVPGQSYYAKAKASGVDVDSLANQQQTQQQPQYSEQPQQTSNNGGFPPEIQAKYEELLAEQERIQAELIEMYNTSKNRINEINNGAAINQEMWQAAYDASVQHLQNMLEQVTNQIAMLLQTYSATYSAEHNTNQKNNTTSQNNSTYSFPLHLYSNDGKVYLGKCVTDEYDRDSIWYPLMGDYSSKYSQTSIWNEYGTYGSTLLSRHESAFNDNAKNPPIIVDNDGTFVGYLTTNSRLENAWTIAELRRFVENNGQ